MKQKLCRRLRLGGRILVISAIVLLTGFQTYAGAAAGKPSANAETLASSQPGIPTGWVQSRPDGQANFYNLSPHAFRISPITPNNPHFVYGGDHLYYTYQDPAGWWHDLTVDSAWGVGSGAALALDSAGNAHISYYDAVNGDLKYATNRGGAWQIEVIASVGWVGKYSDIAIDNTDNPSIVYYNATTSELHYINFDPMVGWTLDEVVASGVADPYHPGWFSLAMDTNAYKAHVSYYDISDSNHGYITWAHYGTGFTWIHSSVESSCVPAASVCKLGEYNSIALNPVTHQPAIVFSYYDAYTTATFWYTEYNGAGWTDVPITPAGDTPTSLSLGMDVSGYPHVAWNESALRYSERNSAGNWTGTTTLDSSMTAGQPVSLAVVGTTAKAAYYDTANKILEFKDHTRLSGWLDPRTIATQGHDVGSCTSLGVDKFGRANISYFDETNKQLLYARYDGGTWTKNIIDSSGLAACFSVMVANPINGDPTVAFLKSGNLYYVVGNGSYWVSPLLVDSGVEAAYDAYQAFGMVLSSDGKPHLLYRKGGHLWYATLEGLTWTHTEVAPATTGSYVALAMGPADQPHAAYYNSGLKYSYYANGTWHPAELIAAEGTYESGGSGIGVALAVDQNEKPTAAFLDQGGANLSVSTRVCITPGSCIWTSSALVDGQAEEYFSLAIDRNGLPHLAASALTSQGFHLDYITWKVGLWSTQTVDANNGNGWFPSISLTADGTPRISYYDSLNDDLMFILKLNQTYLPLAKR